jgi:hypothetical protein
VYPAPLKYLGLRYVSSVCRRRDVLRVSLPHLKCGSHPGCALSTLGPKLLLLELNRNRKLPNRNRGLLWAEPIAHSQNDHAKWDISHIRHCSAHIRAHSHTIRTLFAHSSQHILCHSHTIRHAIRTTAVAAHSPRCARYSQQFAPFPIVFVHVFTLSKLFTVMQTFHTPFKVFAGRSQLFAHYSHTICTLFAHRCTLFAHYSHLFAPVRAGGVNLLAHIRTLFAPCSHPFAHVNM